MSAMPTEVVRAAFDAYQAQDAEAMAALIADDFTFTSPQDNHIDKDAFMDRCFPTAERLVSQEMLELVAAGADGVFILYEYELKTGDRPQHRVHPGRRRQARRDPGVLRRPGIGASRSAGLTTGGATSR